MTTDEQRSAFLTVDEAAALLQCSAPTIRRRIRSGELAAVQLGAPGSAVRIPREELDAWLFSPRTEDTLDA